MTNNRHKAAWATVNTDAGFYPYDRVGSYAYWTKTLGIFLKGSGMLRGHCESPWHAEMKAIINALAVLRKSNHPPILGFIFNRDNMHADMAKKGHELRVRLREEIMWFKKDCIRKIGRHEFDRLNKGQTKYAIFRHVKAHTDVQDKRSYVNRWLDERCAEELRKWKLNHKKS